MKLRKQKLGDELNESSELVDEDNFYNEEFNDNIKEEVNDDLDIDDDLDLNDDLITPGESLSPIEKHSDLLKELTNFNPFFKDFSIRVLGLVWSESQKKYIKNEFVEPQANEKFINWAMTQFGTYLRRNNIITNIPQQDFHYIMRDVVDVICLNIGTRMEEFEIKHNGDYLSLTNNMIHAIELVLMGAGDGKYNKMLTTMTHRSESVQVNDSQNNNQMNNKAGFLQRVKAGMIN